MQYFLPKFYSGKPMCQSSTRERELVKNRFHIKMADDRWVGR